MTIKSSKIMLPQSRNEFNKSTAIVFSQIEENTNITAAHIKCMNALIAGYQTYVRETFGDADSYQESNKAGNAISFTMAYDHFKSLAELNNTRNTSHVKRVLDTLLEHKYTYNHSVAGQPEFGTENFLYRYSVANNKIEFTIPAVTRNAIMYAKGAATLSVTMLNSMLGGHKYAQLLYPALLMGKNYSDITDNKYSVVMTDEELRNALKIRYKLKKGERDYKYREPSRLIDTALKPAVEKINSVNIGINVQDFGHRRIDGIRYWQFDVLETLDPKVTQFLEQYTEELTEVKIQLRALKLSPTSYTELVSKLTNEKELFYMRYVLGLVADYSQKLANKAGYFIKCYQNNREGFESNNLFESMKAQHKDMVEAIAKKERENIKEEFRVKKLNILKELAAKTLNELGIDKKQLQSRFQEEIKHHLEQSDNKNENSLARNVSTTFFSDDVQIALHYYICTKYGQIDEETINRHISGVVVHSTAKTVATREK